MLHPAPCAQGDDLEAVVVQVEGHVKGRRKDVWSGVALGGNGWPPERGVGHHHEWLRITGRSDQEHESG
jgi:hypothetical protein